MHRQKLEDVIARLEAAWVFIGGAPRCVATDNVQATVAGPEPLHPGLTQGFWNVASIGVSSSVRLGSAILRWNEACPVK